MDGITDPMDMSLSKLRVIVKEKEAWRAAVQEVPRVRHDLATEQQQVHKFISGLKKYGTLHEFACHPCAGAMLIFSVSFQF